VTYKVKRFLTYFFLHCTNDVPKGIKKSNDNVNLKYFTCAKTHTTHETATEISRGFRTGPASFFFFALKMRFPRGRSDALYESTATSGSFYRAYMRGIFIYD